jgi:porphobilinogen synthase
MELPFDLIRRPRRLRRTAAIRAMVRETDLSARQLMLPLFVCHGKDVRDPVSSMPGVSHLSVDNLVAEARRAFGLGVHSVLLFGLPKKKNASASEAVDKNGIVQQAVRALKDALPDLVITTDVCVCAYTDHGHCGVLLGNKVDNDASIELLARMAVSHAEAGADITAPSAMMDSQIAALRCGLDDAGFNDTAIMAYAAKYASAFYGPFREAAESAPQSGDRKSYQMDPANAREAMTEMDLDVDEGADILMVKPALAYLDVLRAARERFPHPLAAYNVSGEFSMVKAAAEKGWLDERAAALEILTAIRRAGADIIITYWAADAAEWLAQAGA